MKIKTLMAFLILILLSMSFVASVQSQVQTQTKGGQGFSAADFLARGKPSTGGHEQPLATGSPVPLGKGADRWALVIGISDYDGSVNDLNYCDDDARDFVSALTVTYGWSSSHILTLLDTAATKDNILDGIQWLAINTKAGDEVVFFYSGHGTTGNGDPDKDGEAKDEAIIPSNFQTAGVIWDGTLKTEFENVDSSRIMFFFDSCYAGGMTDLAGDGRLILMACGENQLSIESSLWQNGQFTFYFVGAMTNSQVTFEAAYDYAKANCQRQTPTASDGFLDDMVP